MPARRITYLLVQIANVQVFIQFFLGTYALPGERQPRYQLPQTAQSREQVAGFALLFPLLYSQICTKCRELSCHVAHQKSHVHIPSLPHCGGAAPLQIRAWWSGEWVGALPCYSSPSWTRRSRASPDPYSFPRPGLGLDKAQRGREKGSCRLNTYTAPSLRTIFSSENFSKNILLLELAPRINLFQAKDRNQLLLCGDITENQKFQYLVANTKQQDSMLYVFLLGSLPNFKGKMIFD